MYTEFIIVYFNIVAGPAFFFCFQYFINIIPNAFINCSLIKVKILLIMCLLWLLTKIQVAKNKCHLFIEKEKYTVKLIMYNACMSKLNTVLYFKCNKII